MAAEWKNAVLCSSACLSGRCRLGTYCVAKFGYEGLAVEKCSCVDKFCALSGARNFTSTCFLPAYPELNPYDSSSLSIFEQLDLLTVDVV